MQRLSAFHRRDHVHGLEAEHLLPDGTTGGLPSPTHPGQHGTAHDRWFILFFFNEKTFLVCFLQYFDRIPQTEMVKESQVHLSWVSPHTVNPEWMFGFICSGMNFSQKMFSSRLDRFHYNWLVILITTVRPRECPDLSHVAPQQSEDMIIKSIKKKLFCARKSNAHWQRPDIPSWASGTKFHFSNSSTARDLIFSERTDVLLSCWIFCDFQNDVFGIIWFFQLE